MLARLSACVAVAILSFCFVESASAQATRTWVSGVGDDANPCSRTAPCKTFAGAISKTAANGEINVLDPGGFGAVTITKSISIVAEGATGGVLVSGTNGIIINNATANVTLRGLDFEGSNTSLSAIKILAAASVHIENCLIKGFNVDSGTLSYAVDVENTGATKVVVRDTTMFNNIRGVGINPGAGATAAVALERVRIEGSSQGIRVQTGGTLWLSNSMIVHNNNGVVVVGTGVGNSFGNNVIAGNTNNIPGNPLTPVNLQ